MTSRETITLDARARRLGRHARAQTFLAPVPCRETQTSVTKPRAESYVRAYATALQHQPFELVSIDAFAGPGWVRVRRRPIDPDDASYRKGSPRLALQAGGFHRYVFVDKSRTVTQALEGLRTEFPDRAKEIETITGDANVEILGVLRRRQSRSEGQSPRPPDRRVRPGGPNKT